MKKVILTLLIVSIGMIAGAQDEIKHNRIYGGFSIMNTLHSNFKALGDGPGASTNGMFGYEYRINSKWSVGLDAYLGIAVATGIDNSPNPDYDAALAHFTFLTKGRYSYLNKTKGTKSSRLWSGLGLGFASVGLSYTDYIGNNPETFGGSGFAYQIDALGAETNWKWFSIWSELGYGYQGVIKFGIGVNW